MPGKDFDVSKLDPAVAKALDRVPKAAVGKDHGPLQEAGTDVNGWIFTTKAGITAPTTCSARFDHGYRPRRQPAPGRGLSDLGGGRGRQAYDGANKYVMHFPKGQMPPVNGFWSLTMYNAEYFFVANPLNRYTLSARNTLKPNADGSIDLYIQNESPGQGQGSQLAAGAEGRFVLMMRLYWPKETAPSIIDGTWKPPAVKPVARRVRDGPRVVHT